MIVRSFKVLAYESETVKGQDAIFSPLSLIGAAGNTPFSTYHTVFPTFYKLLMRLMRE
jgi:hypothetical protein